MIKEDKQNFIESHKINYTYYLSHVGYEADKDESSQDDKLILNHEEIEEIISEINAAIETMDAKSFIANLVPLAKFLSNHEIDDKSLINATFMNSYFYNFLMHSNTFFIQKGVSNEVDVLIPSDFLINITYHSEGFCDLLVANGKTLISFFDTLFSSCDNIVVARAIIPIIYNIASRTRISRFTKANILNVLLKYAQDFADEPLGFLYSFLMIGIIRNFDVDDIPEIGMFCSTIADIILERKECSINLMWVMYYIFQKKGLKWGIDRRKENIFFSAIINDRIGELFAEMLNFEGDYTPPMIALYCMSWMALDIGECGIEILDNIDIEIVKRMIEANDELISTRALVFLSNYVATNKSKVDDFIELDFYTASNELLVTGLSKCKVESCLFICASICQSNREQLSSIICETTLEHIIEMLSNIDNIQTQSKILYTIWCIIFKSPEYVEELNNCSLSEILDDIKESDKSELLAKDIERIINELNELNEEED